MLGVAGAVIGICCVLTGVSACTSEAGSGGFGPFAWCGTTFDYQGGATGGFVPKSGGTDLYSNDGDRLIIIVSSSCDKGSHVTWTPSSAARLAQSAYAEDGLPGAVSLQPTSPDAVFTVTATQDGRLVLTITCKPAL
jgi:hypothetical protein